MISGSGGKAVARADLIRDQFPDEGALPRFGDRLLQGLRQPFQVFQGFRLRPVQVKIRRRGQRKGLLQSLCTGGDDQRKGQIGIRFGIGRAKLQPPLLALRRGNAQ